VFDYHATLAKVTLPDGSDYATTAIDTGHAVAWDGTGARP
jgi:endonuclease YncB( thermonuclease family)